MIFCCYCVYFPFLDAYFLSLHSQTIVLKEQCWSDCARIVRHKRSIISRKLFHLLLFFCLNSTIFGCFHFRQRTCSTFNEQRFSLPGLLENQTETTIGLEKAILINFTNFKDKNQLIRSYFSFYNPFPKRKPLSFVIN